MSEQLLFPTMIVMIVSFFICGVPFGFVVARSRGLDVRRVGSGNIGATNVGRTLGKKAAGLTLLLDLGKGFVCTFAAPYILSVLTGIEAGALAPTQHHIALTMVFLSCLLGHIFSPYLDFHGGKGISVGFGAALGLCWPIALGLLAVFIIVVVPFRYVSLASCTAALSMPVFAWFFGFDMRNVIVMTIASALVIWAHRENIGKLIRGEEKRFSFGNA